MDARARFFANMHREMDAEERRRSNSNGNGNNKNDDNNQDDNDDGDNDDDSESSEVDFNITESGHTVTNMITDSLRSSITAIEDMDFTNLASLGRGDDDMMMLTESDRDDLIRVLATTDSAHSSSGGGGGSSSALSNSANLNAAVSPFAASQKTNKRNSLTKYALASNALPEPPRINSINHSSSARAMSAISKAQAIPVPQPLAPAPALLSNPINAAISTNATRTSPLLLGQTTSQPSSHGSSGSTFLSSVLNPSSSASGTGGSGISTDKGPVWSSNHVVIPQAINTNNSNNGIYSHNNFMLSHTPPTHLASSYEVSHFGKRARSGSISGRLRSASDYLEEKGILDRHTKSILKDLIIIGDEVLQGALDRYEAGDPSELEQMISSGALQSRLPQDLDILGDLDLDFLNVQDDFGVSVGDNIDELQSVTTGPQETLSNLPEHVVLYSTSGPSIGISQAKSQPVPLPGMSTGGIGSAAASLLSNSNNPTLIQPTMVSPPYDDGIGDLDFTGEYVSDHQSDYMQQQQQQQHVFSQQQSHFGHHNNNNNNNTILPQAHHGVLASAGTTTSTITSPSPPPPSDDDDDILAAMSEYDQRMRSNSLFSALLNDPRSRSSRASSTGTEQDSSIAGDSIATNIINNNNKNNNIARNQYGQWMDRVPSPATSGQLHSALIQQQTHLSGITIQKIPGTAATAVLLASPTPMSGLAMSLAAAAEQKKREKQVKKEKRDRDREEKKRHAVEDKEAAVAAAATAAAVEHVHVPGSGRPRSWSDPDLHMSHDNMGLMQVERPDGWVGAYSPESRRVRIDRFLEKRNHRVWTKTVKYDVRKNFADSRLRVKGRFVKKEDEQLMRELMSLT